MNTESFNQYYLNDLATTRDMEHGGRNKVHNVEIWKAIRPFSRLVDVSKIDQYVTTIDINSANYRVFVWSDIHFFHTNVIKYSGRPFADAEEMNQHMIDQYNSVVTDKDVVIFGGDISFKGVQDTNVLLDQLKGIKIQIVGNHDMDRKGKLKDMHFDFRLLSLVLNHERKQLYFTHYPLEAVPDNGINVHGHIHQHPAPSGRHLNICVEHTGYKPVLLKDYLSNVQ